MRRLLRWLPGDWRDTVAGDLDEESRRIAPPFRRAWVAWKASQIVILFAWDRVRARRRGGPGLRRWPLEAARDVRHGLRRWRERPLFAAAAIATIALSTGAATALFSMVDGVLLKPLPYPAADRLVIVNRTYPDWVKDPILSKSWDRISLAWPEFFFVGERTRALEVLAVRTSALALLPPDGANAGARELKADVVSATFFSLFAVRPIAGRLFEPADDRDDRRVVLLSEALWRARFGADPAVIGRVIHLADGDRTILGVVPASFKVGFGRPDIWEPLSVTPAARRVDNDRNLDAYARLAPGVTRADAEAEMDTLLRANFRFQTRTGARVTALADRQLAPVRTPLFVLLGGAVLLLVMACANIAGFLVGDAASRVHEMRVRAALGAGRARLVRQLMVESGLLAAAGAAGGFLVGAWGVRALVAMAPASVPRLADVTFDTRALLFAITAAAVTALLSGTLPAMLLSRNGVTAAASGSARVTGHRRTQSRLLVVQLATGVTLLAGAGLFVRTLQNLDRIDVGFSRGNLLTARVSLPRPLYTKPDQFRQYFERAEAAVARLPGVDAAAVTSGLPFATGRASTSIVLGQDAPGGSREVEAQRRFVSPGYFRVMQLPILAGRGFLASDPSTGDAYVVVSREMAQRFWNGEANGRRFSQGADRFVVIGVAGDVRDQTLAAEPVSTFYVSTAQRPPWSNMRVIARTQVPPAALAETARKALAAVDPAVPIEDLTTMDQLVFTSLGDQRYRAVLLTALAIVAAVLAAVGLYGAIARGVAERRREIGVRLALGARPTQVTRMFLAEASRLALTGGAIGLAGAVAAARVSRQLLYGVGTLDAWTVVLVCGGAAAITLCGGYFPARRASRLDPAAVLRD